MNELATDQTGDLGKEPVKVRFWSDKRGIIGTTAICVVLAILVERVFEALKLLQFQALAWAWFLPYVAVISLPTQWLMWKLSGGDLEQ